MASSRTLLVFLALIGLFVIYATGVVARYHAGIAVVVQNQSRETLREVSVHVDPKGKQYPVPNLQSGQSRRLYVAPHGASAINPLLTDASNRRHTEDLAGYMEDGYCGKATGTILPDGSATIENDTFRMFYWPSWLEFVL